METASQKNADFKTYVVFLTENNDFGGNKSVLEKDFHLKTDDWVFDALMLGMWASRPNLNDCRTFHSDRCTILWSNQGRSKAHVWPALCPTAQIKTADINADGLNLQCKKCVGRLEDGERAFSTGRRVIKTHEAERPWATRGKPLLFRHAFQSDLHASFVNLF